MTDAITDENQGSVLGALDTPVVVVAGRAPWQASTLSGDVTWQPGNGGLAQGAFVLAPNSVFIATARNGDDLTVVRAGIQPPDLANRGLSQRYVNVGERDLDRHRAFFGRVTWFLHHDLLETIEAPNGHINDDAIDGRLTSDLVRYLYDGHNELNRIAAHEVLRAVNEIADETGLAPHQIPVLIQDHHFDLVPWHLDQHWRFDDNPRRHELPPPTVLFVHTAVASLEHWQRFQAAMPDLARVHADRLRHVQVSVHDSTWAEQWVANLRHTLGDDAEIVEPWPTVYPPNIDRLQRLVAGKTYLVDHADVVEKAAGRRIIAAVGRVDPAKNFIGLVRAFGDLLERRPDLRDQVVLMLQTSGPRDAREYRNHQRDLQRAVDAVNARFSTFASDLGEELTPIQWDRNGSGHRAVALEREAAVMAFPSFKDGFGHAALEGYAVGARAVLVASPDTGATRWVRSQVGAEMAAAGIEPLIEIDPRNLHSISLGLEQALDVNPAQSTFMAEALHTSAQRLVEHAVAWHDDQVRWANIPVAMRVLEGLRAGFYQSLLGGKFFDSIER